VKEFVFNSITTSRHRIPFRRVKVFAEVVAGNTFGGFERVHFYNNITLITAFTILIEGIEGILRSTSNGPYLKS